MGGFAIVAIVLLTLAQGRAPSARELLNAPRVLTPSEVAAVLSRSQDALTRNTLRFRLIGGTDVGPQILMGVRGQPKIVRWAGAIEGGIVGGVVGPDGKSVPSPPVRFRREYIKIIEFTGRPALRCGESAAEGELVVEYETTPASKEWTAMARQRTPHELGLDMTGMLEMLQGALTLSSGDRRRINGRWARAFVSSWTPAQPTIGEAAPLIGDPIPNLKGEPIVTEGLQTLWIDVRNLRPLRWEVAPGDSPPYGFDFKYGGRAPRPPAGVAAPDCIQSRSHLS